ncbi:hypothetical protein EDB86DRAFT_2297937 [Lactarius hatsudake]|nr:hypothetical protein EDB86DRAFT_2297937 [Lactarius hatsudake]
MEWSPDRVHSPHLRLPHISVIAHEFHVGREAGYLILSLNVAGFVLGPTFGGPELIGQSLVFVCTTAVSAITYISQARANNMVIFAHQRRQDHCRYMGSGQSGHRNECASYRHHF